MLEYKFFEPAFYHMDVPDWGTSYAHTRRARRTRDGLRGHRPSRARHEHRVHRRLSCCGAASWARSISTRRFYADDDLIVGAADPFQLFRILFEVIRGGGLDEIPEVAFMLDQCHNIEKKIPGQIRVVLNVQEATARALLVDTDALAAAQAAEMCSGANGILMDAYNTDVRRALGRAARGAGPGARPDDRVCAQRLPGEDRSRPGRRHPGRMGRLKWGPWPHFHTPRERSERYKDVNHDDKPPRPTTPNIRRKPRIGLVAGGLGTYWPQFPESAPAAAGVGPIRLRAVRRRWTPR